MSDKHERSKSLAYLSLGVGGLLCVLIWLVWGSPRGTDGAVDSVSKARAGDVTEPIQVVSAEVTSEGDREEIQGEGREAQFTPRTLFLQADPGAGAIRSLPGIFTEDSEKHLSPVPLPFAIYTDGPFDPRVRRVLPVVGAQLRLRSVDAHGAAGAARVAGFVDLPDAGQGALHMHSVVADGKLFRPLPEDHDYPSSVGVTWSDGSASEAILVREADPLDNVLVFGGLRSAASMAPTMDRPVFARWVSAPDYEQARAGFAEFARGNTSGLSHLLDHSWIETDSGVWMPCSTWTGEHLRDAESSIGGRLTLSGPSVYTYGTRFSCRIYRLRSNRWKGLCEVSLGVGEDFVFPSLLSGSYLMRWCSFEGKALLATAPDETLEVRAGLNALSVPRFDLREGVDAREQLVPLSFKLRLPEEYPLPTEQLLKRCWLKRRPYPFDGVYLPLKERISSSGFLELETEVEPGEYSLRIPFLGVIHDFRLTSEGPRAFELAEVESTPVVLKVLDRSGAVSSGARIVLENTIHGSRYELADKDREFILLPNGEHVARLELPDGVVWSQTFTVDSQTEVVEFQPIESSGGDPGLYLEIAGARHCPPVSSAGISLCALLDAGGFESGGGASLAGINSGLPTRVYLESSDDPPAMMLFYSERPGYVPVLGRCSNAGSSEDWRVTLAE